MIKRSSSSLFIFILFIYISSAFSQVPQDTSIIKLIDGINKFSLDPSLKKAKWGICVITADSDKTVFALNDSAELTPASTMKAINTAATLHMIGKDYTFNTYLLYDGDISKDSILHGNIIIKGGGDPTLGSPRIDTMNDMKYLLPLWTKVIRKQGIKKIEGAVIGDASIFDDTLTPPSWFPGDLGNYYGAGASGLTFHENSFRIIVKPGKRFRDSAKIAEIDPPIPYIKINNKVLTGTPYAAEDLWVYGGSFDNTREIKGIIPRKNLRFPMRASLPDPAYFCSYSLFKTLTDSGIVVTDSATTNKILKEQGKLKPKSPTVIYAQESPPLDTIIYHTNQRSINTYAEDIIKMLAYEKTGNGSTVIGTQLVRHFWESKGVDLKGFIMKDGSGLSPEDKVSPRQLAEILRVYISDTMFPVFYHTLPIAGVSGTIKSIFKGTIAENNLRAKSGYMMGIRSYAGYVYNKKGKLLTFGIIVNNHTATPTAMRLMLEKIMILIAETEW
jgi:D-alanyl-D-alanine carboxypeptidase/D-alanyl-D-alanine-endopeptidase (penicillin-binding protein 4)